MLEGCRGLWLPSTPKHARRSTIRKAPACSAACASPGSGATSPSMLTRRRSSPGCGAAFRQTFRQRCRVGMGIAQQTRPAQQTASSSEAWLTGPPTPRSPRPSSAPADPQVREITAGEQEGPRPAGESRPALLPGRDGARVWPVTKCAAPPAHAVCIQGAAHRGREGRIAPRDPSNRCWKN